uniref:General transcription factor 3C polypeptide 1-like n=1 Tax=Crassostrea virginica TaxID=6565 RepID=A0A8B8B535_CRAVI|nr:general transcription factor 3C polypeptide 1-like [Crassostrea virginica]
MDTDYRAILTEEIALEGLDGITLQALWVRLENRVNFKMRLDDSSKEFLWECLLSIPDLEFYCLETPRKNLVYKQPISIDPDSGVTVAADFDAGDELYPIKVIHTDGPIIGSCTTYDSRKCVTMEIKPQDPKARPSLKGVMEQFGMRLVILASQEQRFTALCGEELEPSKLYNMSDLNYCILERIGRSRQAGEMSIGDNSLQVFNIIPKSMFYLTLRLIKLGAIRKQSLTVYNKKGQNSLRRLFHLTRFYQQYQSKYNILTNIVVNYLESQPLRRQETVKTRQDCGIDQKSFKKLYQMSKRFRVFSLPYNEMYPESPSSQWYTKKNDMKMVKVLEVLEEEDSDEDVDDEDGTFVASSKDGCLFPRVYERSLLRQAREVLEAAGTEGVTNSDMAARLGIDNLETRMILKTMERRALITTLMTEHGRQKKKVSVSKTFVEGNKLINQINKEKEKLKQSLQDINNKGKEKASAGKDNSATGNDDSSSGKDNISAGNDHSCAGKDNSSSGQDNSSEEKVNTLTGKEDPKKKIKDDDKIDGKALPKSKGKKSPAASQEKEKVKGIEEEVQGIVHNVGRHIRSFRSDVKATAQQMRRINQILDIIKENKIVDGVFPIVKLIREREREENQEHMVDKKSILRLIAILVREKKIHIVNTVLVDGKREKNLQMLLSKEVDPSDQIVKSLIDQAQMKFQAVNKEHLHKKRDKSRMIEENTNIPETARAGILEIMAHRSKLKAENMIYDLEHSKLYDFRPKYSRAKILHNLLWYLVYNYPRDSKPLSHTVEGGETDAPLAQTGTPPTGLDDICLGTQSKEDVMALIEKIPKPPMYKDEFSWKRFLPPLPRHKGFEEGWFLGSDVLLKLPLVIFCNIIYIPYRIQGVRELLEDQEKRYYPIVSLPTSITQQLLYARKYIFSFFSDCVVLCNMGLLSIGPQILKEKDKVFFYLHQKAKLLDTKSSLDGYTQISMETPPDVLEYSFYSQSLVDQYWADLRHIALNSNLGAKTKKEEETGSHHSVVHPLPDARASVTVEDVKDDGFIPGNGLGAAGLDSRLFVHLYRNWSAKYNSKRKSKESKVKVEHIVQPKTKQYNFATLQKMRSGAPGIVPKPKERVSLSSNDKQPQIIRVALAKNFKGNKGGKGIKRKSTDSENKNKIPVKRAKNILKKAKMKKVKPKLQKFIYDEVDIEAYKNKKGQRVSWSSYEDSLLLTSKIATLVMDKKRRGVPIPWSCIRDVLYQYAPQESADKTSSACQRRVTHSLKNQSTKQNLMVYLSEAMQDPHVKQYSEKQYVQASEHACQEFRNLVDYLVKKFSNVELQQTYMPESLSRIKDYDMTCVAQFPLKKKHAPEEPKCRADILVYVAKDIIHSFVSSTYDKQGRSHQMFKLLSQYPDIVLDKAVDSLKADGVVVYNKKKDKLKAADSGTNNIKLSQRYHYLFHSRYPASIFANCVKALKHILASQEGDSPAERVEVKEIKEGGIPAALVQVLLDRQVAMEIEIPEDVVILDPGFKHARGYNPHMSLGKRARLQEILDSDDEDYPFDLDQKETRACVLEQHKAWEPPRAADGPSPYVYEEDGTTLKAYQTSSRSAISFRNDPGPEDSRKSKEKTGRVPTVCASRALVTMRRSRAEQDQELRHYNVQDHFLIQACDVKVGFMAGIRESQHPLGVPHLRPTTAAIIKRVQRFVPFQLDLEEVWSGINPGLLAAVQSVYMMIHDSGELGIGHFRLKNLVNDWEIFQWSLGHLLEKMAVLRVGVTHIKYVSLPNSRAWVIHNFKDTRGRGQPNKVVPDTDEDKLIVSNETTGITKSQGEETQETANKGTTHVQQVLTDSTGNVSKEASGVAENQTEASNSAPAEKSVSETDDVGSTNRVSSVTTQTDLTESSVQNTAEEAGDDEGDLRGGDGGAGSSWRLEKNKELLNTRLGPYTRSMSPRKKSRAEKMTDSTGPKPTSTYERIRLQILPWKKPEGYLNKPVFSLMLHSLLLYVISNPGITFGNLSGRFQPYLLPFHLLELLLILEEIGCVTKLMLTPEPPLSIFTPRQLPHAVSAAEQEENDVVHYEATVNALSFLGMFLEQVQGTDSVQLHRGRKTSQTDGNNVSNGAKTGVSNQNRGDSGQKLEMTSQADGNNMSTETENSASIQNRENLGQELEMTSHADGYNVSTVTENGASYQDRGYPGQDSEMTSISENTHVHETLEEGQALDIAQNRPEVGQTFDVKQELVKFALTSDSSQEVPEVAHTSAGAQELSTVEISGVSYEVIVTEQSREDSGITQEAMEVDD